MHAVYMFRATTDNIDDVVKAFKEWITEKGDENNWYEILCAVNNKGENKIFVADGDYRMRDELARRMLRRTFHFDDVEPTPEEIASHIKGEATINDFKMIAWQICIYEVVERYVSVMAKAKSIEAPEPYLKFETEVTNKFKCKSVKQFKKHFIDTFTELVKDVERELGNTISVTDNWSINYGVRKLFELYDMLVFSTEPLPFVRDGTPYDYRCFDLDPYIDEKEGEETILAVDIHT